MTTSTIAIKRPRAIGQKAFETASYNWYGITSFILSLLFITYLFLPCISILSSSQHLMVTFVFVVLVPIAAFSLGLFSLRSTSSASESANHSTLPSYIALSITSLYFMTALAVPLVLVGCYIIYAYIL